MTDDKPEESKGNWEKPDAIECLQCANWYATLKDYNAHKAGCNYLMVSLSRRKFEKYRKAAGEGS